MTSLLKNFVKDMVEIICKHKQKFIREEGVIIMEGRIKLEAGMYVRTINDSAIGNGIIGKIKYINYEDRFGNGKYKNYFSVTDDENWFELTDNDFKKGRAKASHNIIDLVEYMDLLEIENPVKIYDRDIEVSLFNPVRCDGFTTFEDGTTCIILNLDYLVNVKDLKIKSILTHERFESVSYHQG